MTSELIKTAFLYCCPGFPSCPAHLNNIGWATWAAIKKYSHDIQCLEVLDTFAFELSHWMFLFNFSLVLNSLMLNFVSSTDYILQLVAQKTEKFKTLNWSWLRRTKSMAATYPEHCFRCILGDILLWFAAWWCRLVYTPGEVAFHHVRFEEQVCHTYKCTTLIKQLYIFGKALFVFSPIHTAVNFVS